MVVELAKPYDEEEVKRMLARAQYQPNPQPVQQQEDPLVDLAQSAGADVVGSAAEKYALPALGKAGAGLLAKGKAMANAGALAKTGFMPYALGGGAGAGAGLGAMAMSALPILAGAAVLGKVFKLFNAGGYVGPLGNMSKVKYKTHGGDVTHEYEVNMGPLSKGV